MRRAADPLRDGEAEVVSKNLYSQRQPSGSSRTRSGATEGSGSLGYSQIQRERWGIPDRVDVLFEGWPWSKRS